MDLEKQTTYYETQMGYIQRMLSEGYIIFDIRSPWLNTCDIDKPLTKELCGTFVTTSKNNGKHLYCDCSYLENIVKPSSWPEKAILQFQNGSDPARELHTLNRRLHNERYAELMCELNLSETVTKLREFEQKGLGKLFTTLEEFEEDLYK